MLAILSKGSCSFTYPYLCLRNCFQNLIKNRSSWLILIFNILWIWRHQRNLSAVLCFEILMKVENMEDGIPLGRNNQRINWKCPSNPRNQKTNFMNDVESKKKNHLKVQPSKSCNYKYMITSAHITNIEIFVFIAALVSKILGCKNLLINRKDNRNC